MNIDKLKDFVNSLDKLSDNIKEWDVDMDSEEKPTCNTPGCHAGLISIVAKELPELQDSYERIIFSGWKSHGSRCRYSAWFDAHERNYRYSIWADALAEFLGFENKGLLRLWANDNPKIWGNKFGGGMFYYPSAFTDDEDKQLTHRDIIEHWKQVLVNIENEGEMNEDKLKQFVNALDKLSDNIKDWEVNMISHDKPTCHTPGCHAGLISIVAKDLPELQDIYMPLYTLESECRGKRENQYRFYIWSTALAVFLGFKDEQDLEIWAKDNPKLWGNKFGEDMFTGWRAFTNDFVKHLTHRDIIEHWKQVLKNIEV